MTPDPAIVVHLPSDFVHRLNEFRNDVHEHYLQAFVGVTRLTPGRLDPQSPREDYLIGFLDALVREGPACLPDHLRRRMNSLRNDVMQAAQTARDIQQKTHIIGQYPSRSQRAHPTRP